MDFSSVSGPSRPEKAAARVHNAKFWGAFANGKDGRMRRSVPTTAAPLRAVNSPRPFSRRSERFERSGGPRKKLGVGGCGGGRPTEEGRRSEERAAAQCTHASVQTQRSARMLRGAVIDSARPTQKVVERRRREVPANAADAASESARRAAHSLLRSAGGADRNEQRSRKKGSPTRGS